MTTLPASVDQDFAFAHGRIGVLQQLLLSRSDVDRLLGAHDAAEAERILTELKMTANIHQGLRHEEEILDAVAQWVQREVRQMAPEEKADVFAILWMLDDAPLLAYLIKQARGLTSAISREPHSAVSAFDRSALLALVETGESDHLPARIVACVRTLRDADALTPAAIDAAVAQCMADEQIARAKKSGSAGIRRFVRHGIDVRNIQTALRTTDLPHEERLLHLIAGGSVSPKQLLGDRATIAHAIVDAELGYTLAETVRNTDADPGALQRALSDVLAEDIALLWNVPLSIEPLFAFAALTFSQLRLLRVLLIGKRSGLSPQEIKKILPPFLPATHYVL